MIEQPLVVVTSPEKQSFLKYLFNHPSGIGSFAAYILVGAVAVGFWWGLISLFLGTETWFKVGAAVLICFGALLRSYTQYLKGN